MYRVDFKDIAIKNLPPHWRKPIKQAFIQSLVSGLDQLNRDFTAAAAADILNVVPISQIALNNFLNDKYDRGLRRIWLYTDNDAAVGETTLYIHVPNCYDPLDIIEQDVKERIFDGVKFEIVTFDSTCIGTGVYDPTYDETYC